MTTKQYTVQYTIDHYKNLGSLTNDFRNYNLANLVVSKIKGKSVLDIGCGTGYLLSILKKKGMRVLGVEPNKGMINLAKQLHPELDIIKGFAEDIDKIKKKFDNIIMIDVLEHLKYDAQQIKKIYKQLNREGRLIVVVPAFPFLYGKRDINNGHYRRYSRKDIDKKLKDAGFKIVYFRHWNMLGFFPYLFYEKILGKELNTELRTEKITGAFKKTVNKLLNWWFKNVENNFDCGFGLSMLYVVKK